MYLILFCSKVASSSELYVKNFVNAKTLISDRKKKKKNFQQEIALLSGRQNFLVHVWLFMKVFDCMGALTACCKLMKVCGERKILLRRTIIIYI